MTHTTVWKRWFALNSEIAALSVLTALWSGTDDIVWRTLPFGLAALGIPIGVLGALQSVNIGADLLTELPAGAYVDHRGRKRAIVGGLAALGFSVALLALAGGLAMLVIAVFLIGVTEAVFLRGSSVRFFEAATPSSRGRGIAWSAIAAALGSFVALLLAGAFFDVGTQVLYLALAAVAVGGALASIPFLNDIVVKRDASVQGPLAPRFGGVLRRLRDEFGQIRDHRFLEYSVLVQLFLSLSFGSSYVFIPALGILLGLGSAEILLLYAVMRLASAVLSYAGGWLSDRYRRGWFFVGRPVSAFGLAAILALAVSPAVFAIGVLAIAATSFTSPGSSAYFMGRFEETERGKAGGVNNFFTSAVGVVAPLLGGLIWTVSPTGLYVFAALVSVPGIIFALVAIRLPSRPPSP